MRRSPVPDPDASSTSIASTGSEPSRAASALRFLRESYFLAALAVFVLIVISCWHGFVETDEELYFLGSRHLADPSFLARDFTWSRLPPTSALFDHMVAPLWSFLDEFAIANLGRLVFWGSFAWALAFLARTIRLPAWSLVVGSLVWLLWGQSLATCGTPLDGFQVKSFAYPLIVLSLALVLRGRPAWAGFCAGLATAFHVVVGGWAFLALGLSLLFNRDHVSWRRLGVFVLAAALFIGPVVVSVLRFHGGHVTSAEQARMDSIYVLFAMPHCCDVDYFSTSRLMPMFMPRAILVFALAPVVVFGWPDRRASRILGAFVVALILFFVAGVIARRLDLYGVLKLYPLQLGNAFPALFLFVFVAGWLGIGGAVRRFGRLLASVVILGTIGLALDRGVASALIDQPQYFINEVRESALWKGQVSPSSDEPLFSWIRAHTPRDAIFITPLILEFWSAAERAQVASMRHPPLDRRIIEWKERLEALNGFRPFEKRGFEIAAELTEHEGALSIADLIRIRERYGARYYVVRGERNDLGSRLLARGLSADQVEYSVYDITNLGAE